MRALLRSGADAGTPGTSTISCSGKKIRILSVLCTVSGITAGETLTVIAQAIGSADVIWRSASVPIQGGALNLEAEIGVDSVDPNQLASIDPVTGLCTYICASELQMVIPSMSVDVDIVILVGGDAAAAVAGLVVWYLRE